MARVLEMTFNTELGNSKTMRVIDAKDPLSNAEVSAAMDAIVAKNIFSGTGGDLTGKIKAQIVTTTASEVALV
ncbi:MAG TPA: DUF2922 domain-containing protein [Syntrophomonadaceae bacterium]|nr:DUF2922 domain-containing protein [Syntrophomonadaceae bacterium]